MRWLPCIVLSLLLGTTASAQVNWMQFEDLKDSLRRESKPILIFIHADWCHYCKLQDANTFSDSTLAAHLNQVYYCLRLNAEEQDKIRFLNRTYKYNPSGSNTGQNELATRLGTVDGILTLPTTILLNRNRQVRGRKVGFVDADDLLEIVAIPKSD